MQRKMGGVLAETWARLTACVLRIMEKMEHYGIRSVAKLCFSAENDASDDTTETQEQRTSNPRNALTRFLCSPSIETWILCFLVVLVVDIVGAILQFVMYLFTGIGCLLLLLLGAIIGSSYLVRVMSFPMSCQAIRNSEEKNLHGMLVEGLRKDLNTIRSYLMQVSKSESVREISLLDRSLIEKESLLALAHYAAVLRRLIEKQQQTNIEEKKQHFQPYLSSSPFLVRLHHEIISTLGVVHSIRQELLETSSLGLTAFGMTQFVRKHAPNERLQLDNVKTRVMCRIHKQIDNFQRGLTGSPPYMFPSSKGAQDLLTHYLCPSDQLFGDSQRLLQTEWKTRVAGEAKALANFFETHAAKQGVPVADYSALNESSVPWVPSNRHWFTAYAIAYSYQWDVWHRAEFAKKHAEQAYNLASWLLEEPRPIYPESLATLGSLPTGTLPRGIGSLCGKILHYVTHAIVLFIMIFKKGVCGCIRVFRRISQHFRGTSPESVQAGEVQERSDTVWMATMDGTNGDVSTAAESKASFYNVHRSLLIKNFSKLPSLETNGLSLVYENGTLDEELFSDWQELGTVDAAVNDDGTLSEERQLWDQLKSIGSQVLEVFRSLSAPPSLIDFHCFNSYEFLRIEMLLLWPSSEEFNVHVAGHSKKAMRSVKTCGSNIGRKLNRILLNFYSTLLLSRHRRFLIPISNLFRFCLCCSCCLSRQKLHESAEDSQKYLEETHDNINCVFIRPDSDLDQGNALVKRDTVMLCEPNGCVYELYARMTQDLHDYTDRGYNVLVWNYRGYCLSTGLPTISNVRHDAARVVDDAKRIFGSEVKNLIVYGTSIGGCPACYLGELGHADILIGDRNFGDLASIAGTLVAPWAETAIQLVASREKWLKSNVDPYIASNCPKMLLLSPKNDDVIHVTSSLVSKLAERCVNKSFVSLHYPTNAKSTLDIHAALLDSLKGDMSITSSGESTPRQRSTYRLCGAQCRRCRWCSKEENGDFQQLRSLQEQRLSNGGSQDSAVEEPGTCVDMYDLISVDLDTVLIRCLLRCAFWLYEDSQLRNSGLQTGLPNDARPTLENISKDIPSSYFDRNLLDCMCLDLMRIGKELSNLKTRVPRTVLNDREFVRRDFVIRDPDFLEKTSDDWDNIVRLLVESTAPDQLTKYDDSVLFSFSAFLLLSMENCVGYPLFNALNGSQGVLAGFFRIEEAWNSHVFDDVRSLSTCDIIKMSLVCLSRLSCFVDETEQRNQHDACLQQLVDTAIEDELNNHSWRQLVGELYTRMDETDARIRNYIPRGSINDDAICLMYLLSFIYCRIRLLWEDEDSKLGHVFPLSCGHNSPISRQVFDSIMEWVEEELED